MNPLADGAFLLSKVTITEDGEKTELLRDQMKIYSNGKFMFAFSIFWSYVWFSQFLLINAQIKRKTFPLSREFKKSGFSISPLATISFGSKSDIKSFANDAGFEWELVP